MNGIPPKTGPAYIDMNAEVVVQGTLYRLARYYAERAQSALKSAKAHDDPATVATHAITASNWLAKHDAVLRVAENLEIALEPEEEQ